jgi:serine/threonine protein kinase
MAFTAGDRLGPYEIVALIGAGGMGEVYRARDPRLQRLVAVKVLPAAFAADPERVRRFDARGSCRDRARRGSGRIGAHRQQGPRD